MKKSIFIVLVVMVFLPLIAYGWDSKDALDEAYEDSRKTQRDISQWKRGMYLDNLRDAQERQDKRDAEFHRQQLERQLLQDRFDRLTDH